MPWARLVAVQTSGGNEPTIDPQPPAVVERPGSALVVSVRPQRISDVLAASGPWRGRWRRTKFVRRLRFDAEHVGAIISVSTVAVLLGVAAFGQWASKNTGPTIARAMGFHFLASLSRSILDTEDDRTIHNRMPM